MDRIEELTLKLEELDNKLAELYVKMNNLHAIGVNVEYLNSWYVYNQLKREEVEEQLIKEMEEIRKLDG